LLVTSCMMLLCQRGESFITARPQFMTRPVASTSYHRVVGPNPRYASTTSTTEEENTTIQGGLPPWLPSFLTAATGTRGNITSIATLRTNV
jgi:hypothetical protein